MREGVEEKLSEERAAAREKVRRADADRTRRVILAEYDRLGLEPMWASEGVLLSPSLLSTLGRLRRPEVKNSIEEDQVENQSGGSEA